VFTAYLKNSVTRSVDPLRVIDWRVAACFVGGMVGDRARYSIDGRREYQTNLSLSRATDASRTKARHPREQNWLHYATPIQMPSKESGYPYIVGGRPEKPEATHALVSMRLIQYCDCCQKKEACNWVKWHVAHARSTEEHALPRFGFIPC
jgi:hypothetical protein